MWVVAKSSRTTSLDHHMSVHQDASSNSVPPSFTKETYVKPISQQSFDKVPWYNTLGVACACKEGGSAKDNFVDTIGFGSGYSNSM
jgi:hypothetical protein